MAKRKKAKSRAGQRGKKPAKRTAAPSAPASPLAPATAAAPAAPIAPIAPAAPVPPVPPVAAPPVALAKSSAKRPLRKVLLQTHTPPGPEYRRLCELARKLPGVEESTSYGTPSLKVKGRILCRLRSEAEGALALRCDVLDRQMLLQADPDAFFLTDHYRAYPMILVRLNRVRRSALPDLVLRAWRLVAPAKWVAEYDARENR